MTELERDWSYEDALNAHLLLDALEAAEEQARLAAEAAR